MASLPPLPHGLRRIRDFAREQCLLFLLALGFLSRLAPARQADNAQMSASVFYYPLAGLCIGAVACLPVLAWDLTGTRTGHALVPAWLYVLLCAWLTRALHLDGLADVLDAVGSGKRGEAFRAVLKDSRIGAFGAAGLALVICGHCFLVAAVLESGAWSPLLFAPLYGRCLPIVLVVLTRPYADTGLGALLNAAPRSACLAFAVFTALTGGLFCLGPGGLLAALLLTLPVLFFLVALSRREGGYNGDFLGFAIVAGELAALLAALL